MEPSTWTSVAVLLVALVPGATYTWAFERQASAFGVTMADRTLRFVAISLVYHLVLGWPEFLVLRSLDLADPGPPEFAAGWLAAAVAFVVPAGVGSTLGGLYASRSTRDGWAIARRWLNADHEARVLRVALGRTPAPRAWDHVFSERPLVYLRIWTTDGEALAGRFADRSYAGGFPHEADLYLEEEWSLDDDGSLKGSLGYPLYLPAAQIARVEIVPQQAA